MAIVQSTYVQKHAVARNGQIANLQTCTVDSYLVTATAGIAFGVACKQGTNAKEVLVGVAPIATTPFASTDFVGVSVLDPTRDPADEDTYKKGAHASLIVRGDLWVQVESAVTVGGDVTANADTGELSSAAGSAVVTGGQAHPGQVVIPGARWMSAAAADGLAQLRLGTFLPAT